MIAISQPGARCRTVFERFDDIGHPVDLAYVRADAEVLAMLFLVEFLVCFAVQIIRMRIE
jgi:hypothetical protein